VLQNSSKAQGSKQPIKKTKIHIEEKIPSIQRNPKRAHQKRRKVNDCIGIKRKKSIFESWKYA
jgi:hypothetical protein